MCLACVCFCVLLLQLARRKETERKFEEYETRLQERAAAADARKAEHHLKFLEQQAEQRRETAAKQAKAKERVEAAQAMQDKMAEDARRAFEEKERLAEERREMLVLFSQAFCSPSIFVKWILKNSTPPNLNHP